MGDPENFWSDADIISVYTRAQALAEGALYDVSPMAREAGFYAPVAVTAAVYALCRAVEEGSRESFEGRLRDVLSVCGYSSRYVSDSDRCFFQVSIDGELIQMCAVIGPGDDGEPVITVMFEGEG